MRRPIIVGWSFRDSRLATRIREECCCLATVMRVTYRFDYGLSNRSWSCRATFLHGLSPCLISFVSIETSIVRMHEYMSCLFQLPNNKTTCMEGAIDIYHA